MTTDQEFEKYLFSKEWKKVIKFGKVLWTHKAIVHPIPFEVAIRKQAKMTRKANG